MALTVVLLAGVFSAWAAILYFQIRHAGLTALAIMSLLPVWLLGYGIAVWLDAMFVAFTALFACVFCTVSAQCVMDRIARGICDGLSSREAVRAAFAEMAMPILSILLACGLSLPIVTLLPYGLEDCLAAIALLLIASASVFACGWLARWLPYSENFIAAANSARETRERWIDRLSFVSQARWGVSLSGIAIVLGAIAFFGERSLRLQGGPSWIVLRCALVGLAVFVVFALALRNWRLAIAEIMTLFFAILFGLWAFSASPMPVLPEDCLVFAIAVAISAVPMLLLASTVDTFLRGGDDTATALSRAIQQSGPGAVLASITAAVPWFIVTVSGGIARYEFATASAAIAGTVLIFPAFAGAIYLLFPRYRSVEEVFGKR